MAIDPIVAGLVTAVTTLAGLYHQALIRRAERAEQEAADWQRRYFRQIGMTDLALDEAERRS